MEECDSDVLEGEIIRTKKKRKKNVIEMDEMPATQQECVQIEMLPGMLRHEHMSAPAQSSQVSHSISMAGKSNSSSPDVHMNTRTGRDEKRNDCDYFDLNFNYNFD